MKLLPGRTLESLALLALLAACAGILLWQHLPSAPKPGEFRAAIASGDVELVGAMIRRGAKLHWNLGDHMNALHHAAWGGHRDVAVLLIQNGADVNGLDGEWGWTPLAFAVDGGSLDTVKALLGSGARTIVPGKPEDYLLRVAAASGRPEVMQELRGLIPATLDMAAAEGDTGRVMRLLDEGSNVRGTDERGRTPLHWGAACWAQEGTLDVLVRRGADPDARDKEGRTALHLAVLSGGQMAVRALIQRGARADTRDFRDRTPLHDAATRDDADVAKMLLEAGVDVNAATGLGQTPLHSAAYGNAVHVARVLCAAGADLNAREKDGESALAIAQWHGHRAFVRFLQDRGAR